MASARHVIVAGAGIAGLTAALALARAGLRTTVLEQAAKLEETGAGIQLSPNATRVLIALGLRERLAPFVMAPQAIRVMAGGSGREIVRIPLGADAERRYGAPYWTIHRGDLQAALAAAAQDAQDVELKLGARVEDFATHGNGVTVQAHSGGARAGRARRRADRRRRRMVDAERAHPGPQRRRASATAPPGARWCRPTPCRKNSASRWCICGSGTTPISCIIRSKAAASSTSSASCTTNGTRPAGRPPAIARKSCATSRALSWAEKARALIAIPEQWLKWALYDRKRRFAAARGPVTLIGDAAHPMLPFLAQGAGMAIEDAAVLADMLGKYLDDPADALRAYEGARWHRTARAQHHVPPARPHLWAERAGSAASAISRCARWAEKNCSARYDWLYSWRPPESFCRASRP